ncbi:hypothetical protein CLOM_g19681 [Closterium sp. NIES-68]|nr:hypothetical protein CLOM_g19681 [Closterium sp. NIES-68]
MAAQVPAQVPTHMPQFQALGPPAVQQPQPQQVQQGMQRMGGPPAQMHVGGGGMVNPAFTPPQPTSTAAAPPPTPGAAMGGESMVQGSGGLEGPGQGSVGEMQQMQQQGGFGQGQAQGSMAGGAMGDANQAASFL